jgi:type III pantothenate kinase
MGLNKMIYVVDIGNTNLTIGLLCDGLIIKNWRLTTQWNRTRDEYMVLFNQLLQFEKIDPLSIAASVISCVAPPVLENVKQALQIMFKSDPFIIQPGIRLNLNIFYDKPQDVGADRVANAVAAKSIYGFPCIIIDSGTATTFCVVDKGGDYIGGAIFPGIHLIADSLFNATALLPRVAFFPVKSVVGNSTITSIQSGLYFGYLEFIAGMIHRIRKELGEEIQVIATGGLAESLKYDTNVFNILDPHLTLKGLEIIYKLNLSVDSKLATWEFRSESPRKPA